MPRPSKGARLYQRKDTGQWVIIDGTKQRRTGTTDRREAEAIFAGYIIDRGRPTGPSEPDQMMIADVLDIYGRERAPSTADPERIANAIMPLLDFWGELPVSSITGGSCRRYGADRRIYRGTPRERPAGLGTVRRELGCLAAALRYCAGEGYLTRAPEVKLPEKRAPRDRWLTRAEAARLLRAARSHPKSRHLAPFILVALHTGTRKEAILALRFAPHTAGGWIDTERGVLYRKAEDMRETKKRRPPVRMPQKLLAHARRWKRNRTWVVEYEGARVGSIKTAWRRAIRDADLPEVTPHTLKHTAVTWAMHKGVPLADAAGFFGTTVATLESVYLHHHPSFQEATAKALDGWK
ncbi:tyrosine-type recombinase/integrase [Rhodovulum sulfidophilum]|uniref:Tyrosine-type recombinase/integrase n=1 Tax=Rhodovulum sulfidophilum TaxID=35806 RepID=A0ABS1RNA0_RHOSU|nr:tyrosine-type recombinase/integrase [Rhodovulum sulfidophilum]MBL3607529.1 tyrosine-type recombinase/integrase [Rhodovulum sulfidophilum]